MLGPCVVLGVVVLLQPRVVVLWPSVVLGVVVLWRWWRSSRCWTARHTATTVSPEMWLSSEILWWVNQKYFHQIFCHHKYSHHDPQLIAPKPMLSS